jgi:hypothetical protein
MTALGYRTDTLFANFNRPTNDEIARVLVFRESLWDGLSARLDFFAKMM